MVRGPVESWPPSNLPNLDAITAGCGCAAAGYLWLASINLNRLFFASLEGARAGPFKVNVAASFMSAHGWAIEPISRKVEHPTAMNLMAKAAD